MMDYNKWEYAGTDEPGLKPRVFRDRFADLPWGLDAMTPDGRYTEALWQFATWAEAVAAVPEFIEFYGIKS